METKHKQMTEAGLKGTVDKTTHEYGDKFKFIPLKKRQLALNFLISERYYSYNIEIL